MAATFTWYGHSAVELESGGTTILFDPWFSNPTSPKAPEAVDRCDLLLVSHGHFDHFDDAIALAARLRPAWPCIHELSLYAGRRLPGGDDAVIGFNKGGTVEAADCRVTMVHADHSAGHWDMERGTPVAHGEPVGFVVELPDGPRTYFAGDTDVFGDMAFIRELHAPEVGFVPIGGHYTMGPRGAARAVELLGLRAVVPIHYGTFPVLAGTPEELRAALAERGLGHVEVLSPERGVATALP